MRIYFLMGHMPGCATELRLYARFEALEADVLGRMSDIAGRRVEGMGEAFDVASAYTAKHPGYRWEWGAQDLR